MAKFLPYLLILISLQVFSQSNKVYILTLDGAITPAATDYIVSGLEKAKTNNAQCLVLELNTPGGLLESTRIIVSKFLSSEIPIIVYVSPTGSRAASAGVFITMAANIAAMAPGTNIGAAHPVSTQGKMDSTMSEKVTNDAAAFIRTISEKRKRNIEWAEEAVRKSVSITETEALQKNVINFISKDLKDLLKDINGYQVKVGTSEITKIINTNNVKIISIDMTLSQKLLMLISNPNIAYLLFMIGMYGILFEFFNPGAIFPAVAGGISLILALYAFHTLPVNYAGIALIIFAIILFILEIKIVSHGLLTIGGTISLILGSVMLINKSPSMDVLIISWETILFVVVLTVLFFTVAIGLGIKAQRRKKTTGSEGLINEIGETITELNPSGKIKIHGEIWDAESITGNLAQGNKVVVQSITNLKLFVKKKD